MIRSHRKRPPLTRKPIRRDTENDAGFGVRLAAWYQHNQAAGYSLDQLPRPNEDETRCLLSFDELTGANGTIGNDHRLADPEPLETMLRACEGGRRCLGSE